MFVLNLDIPEIPRSEPERIKIHKYGKGTGSPGSGGGQGGVVHGCAQLIIANKKNATTKIKIDFIIA